MEEKTIFLVVLGAVLMVAVVGFLGMMRTQTTGAAQLQGKFHKVPLPSEMCACEINNYDNMGNLIETVTQKIRVKRTADLTVSGCMDRCAKQFGLRTIDEVNDIANFGPGKGIKKVLVYAYPTR